MNTAQIREEIGKYIQKADERFLQLVYSMIKADENATIGYNTDGTSITKEDIVARAKKSEEDIKSGKVKALSELRKEIKRWQ